MNIDDLEVLVYRMGNHLVRTQRVTNCLNITASMHENAFMRTTLDLPDPIFRQLKAESALRGLKLKELIAEFVQAGLRRSHETAVPRSRSPLPTVRKPSGRMHAALSSREIDSLLSSDDADWQP